MKSFLLVILNFIITTTSLDIDCDYQFIESKITELNLDTIEHVKISNRYTCFAKQYRGNDDKFIGAVNGQHLEGLSNVDVRAITFLSMEFLKIPQGLGKVFPNLMSLTVDNCDLEEIKSEDLKDFKNLTFFSAMGNHLKILNSDLFKYNPKIQIINFAENNLQHIGTRFIDYIPNLGIALFADNDCITTNFEIQQNFRRMSVNLGMMSKELQKSCPPHEENDVQSDYYYEYNSYDQQMNFYNNPFYENNQYDYYMNLYRPNYDYYNYIDQDYYSYYNSFQESDYYSYYNPNFNYYSNFKDINAFSHNIHKLDSENDENEPEEEVEIFDYNFNKKDEKGNLKIAKNLLTATKVTENDEEIEELEFKDDTKYLKTTKVELLSTKSEDNDEETLEKGIKFENDMIEEHDKTGK